MRKTLLAGITALAMGFSINVFAEDTAPKVNYNNYNGEMVISGAASKGSYITLKILNQGEDYDALKTEKGEDAVFYCDQTVSGDTGYTFDFKFGGNSGTYKALVSDGKERTVVNFQFGITRPEDYADAVILLNTAANTGYDEFMKVLGEQSVALGFDYTVELTDEASENLYNHIKKSNLKPSEFEDNVKIYRSYALMDAVSDGKIENIIDYIDDIFFEDSELRQELMYTAGLNSKAGEYMTEKMKAIKAESIGEFNDELETAYVLGTVMYSNGYGDIVEAFEKYGADLGITGKISTKVCQKMRGKDYDADDIGNAYDDLADSNSGGGSSGGSGGGSGSSANRTAASSSGASTIMGSGTPETKPVEEAEEMIFSDLSEKHWSAEAVKWLKDKEIVSGTDTGAFEPERAVTREEFTKMILLACGFEPEDGSAEFADVEDGAWYDKYVYTAELKGIVNGVGENLFGTGMNIIRQDMSVMADRAAKICGTKLDKIRKYKEFSDESDISDYAAESVKYLYECGVINGKGENSFDPMGNATRAEAAKILYEAFKGGIAE